MDIERLLNPPMLYRTAPFWSWNDRLDAEELKRQIDEMIDKGWGSFFMHSRVGLVTGYLSDEWMELTRTCAEHAEEKGAYVWLYDEDKWPSGFAGGIVPAKDPAYRSRALILLNEDEITENDTVLKETETDDGKAYICKRVSPLGNPWFNGFSYVDLMNPETVREFLRCTHEAYKKECGDSFGKEIKGIFTDEPCYNTETHYNQKPVIPWSDSLPDFFFDLKGYHITPHVEKLFFETGNYQKIRFDFYDAATRLFMKSFMQPYYEWCEKNNLYLTGHLMSEDNMISQTKWIGAAMPHYQFMHWPGIDKLSRHIEQHVTVKQLTSAAEQLGKERTLCEVFGCIGQQSSFFHRKWITDWQAVLGINFVNLHLSLYSMRGERKRDYPANLFLQQPWWDDERQFSDYTARISYALTQGKREADILVLHPIASVWSEYSPLHGKYNAGNNYSLADEYHVEKEYNDPFEKLSLLLIANKLDFHYGDEIIIENHASVAEGKLNIGSFSYSTVIVPPMLTIRENTLRLLKEFASGPYGNRLLFIGKGPSLVDGISKTIDWPDNITRVRSVEDAVEKLGSMYPDRIAVLDKLTGKNADKVICQVRSTLNERFVFIANTDEERETEIDIYIPEQRAPFLFDTMEGKLYRLRYEKANSKIYIRCTIHPAGSMFLIFSDDKFDAPEAPAYLQTGIEFKRNLELIGRISNWNINVKEENVLPVYYADFYVENKKILDNEHIVFAIHNVFNKLKDGTPIRIEYTFNIRSMPDSPLTAIVEMAENFDRITLNGHELKPLKRPGEQGAFNDASSWKDVNFTRVPLDGYVVPGRNVLTLEGKKANNITGPGCHKRVDNFKEHRPTELEAIYIIGDFIVTGDTSTGLYIEAKSGGFHGTNLTQNGYPFYAGKAEFTGTVQINDKPENILLKIKDANAASLRLFVNGQYAGTAYAKPFMFDIGSYLKQGENEIKIVASTTLFNLLGPNWISNVEDNTFISPRTFFEFDKFTRDYVLRPFGIGDGLLLKAE